MEANETECVFGCATEIEIRQVKEGRKYKRYRKHQKRDRDYGSDHTSSGKEG